MVIISGVPIFRIFTVKQKAKTDVNEQSYNMIMTRLSVTEEKQG